MPRRTLSDYQSSQDTTRREALRLDCMPPDNFVKDKDMSVTILPSSVISNFSTTAKETGLSIIKLLSLPLLATVSLCGATNLQADEFVKFKSRSTDRCLNVHGRENREGGDTSLYRCTDTPDQEWTIVPVGSGFSRIVNQATGRCLAIQGSGSAMAARVYRCSTSQNQHWRVLRNSTHGGVVQHRRLNACLNANSRRHDYNGAPATATACINSVDQRFFIEDLSRLLDNTPFDVDLSTAQRNATVRLEKDDGTLNCTGVLVSSTLVLSAGHCWDPQPRANPGGAVPFGIADWETPGDWNPLPDPLFARIGSNDARLGQRFRMVGYNLAGNTDMILFRLERSVPRSLAIPAEVVTSDGPANNNTSIRAYLNDKRLLLAGWSRPFAGADIPRFRKIVSDVRFNQWPANFDGNVDPSQLDASSVGGAVVQGGDSGGPLYVEEDGRLKLIAVTQGHRRHVMTFFRGGFKLSRNRPQPDLALWLNEQLGKEDCLAMDSSRVRVAWVNGRWQVIEPTTRGNISMFDFGTDRSAAARAVQVLRSYRIDRSCYVNRPNPTFRYLLVDDAMPQGPLRGESCTPIDLDRLRYSEFDSGWTINNGTNRYLYFTNPLRPTGTGQTRRTRYAGFNEAHLVMSLIHDYQPRFLCSVGDRRSGMMYLRR